MTTSELANKVRSQVSYDADGSTRKWGFLCDGEEDQFDTKALLKLYIDPNF